MYKKYINGKFRKALEEVKLFTKVLVHYIFRLLELGTLLYLNYTNNLKKNKKLKKNLLEN